VPVAAVVGPMRNAADEIEMRLARIAALNSSFRAFTTIDAAGARARAREVDAATEEGRWLGPLHGMVVAVKDNIDTEGIRTACGSRLFADRIPNADAPVVRRLRNAGAIIVGKAAMMELAFGVRSLDAIGGQCRNPWNPEHVPGGSSGGSAAAVALDLCDGALGTDTGGSVRMPASFCGVTGLRPTHGLVSNRGVLPVSVSFDTVGPMARHIENVARLLAAIAGYDADDPDSVDRPLVAAILDLDGDVSGLRIGLPRNFYFADVDPEVEAAVRNVAEILARAGAELVEVTLDGAEEAHRHATTIILCDACALHADALDHKVDLVTPQVRERMIKGRDRSGVDYAHALRFREAWRKRLRDLFASVDILLMPSAPRPAPLIDDGIHLEDSTRHATRFTYGGGLAGIPGLSLPCGRTRGGLPIGVLLEAAWWNEAVLVRAGKAWQRLTDWHLHRPPAAVMPAAVGGPNTQGKRGEQGNV
jgi:aspartyl-tRNA(Asn)/glutamyl-tRNA(Gln) amidotransferase subunit A